MKEGEVRGRGGWEDIEKGGKVRGSIGVMGRVRVRGRVWRKGR